MACSKLIDNDAVKGAKISIGIMMASCFIAFFAAISVEEKLLRHHADVTKKRIPGENYDNEDD